MFLGTDRDALGCGARLHISDRRDSRGRQPCGNLRGSHQSIRVYRDNMVCVFVEWQGWPIVHFQLNSGRAELGRVQSGMETVKQPVTLESEDLLGSLIEFDAGSSRHWRDSAQTPRVLVIAFGRRLCCLAEQRGRPGVVADLSVHRGNRTQSPAEAWPSDLTVCGISRSSREAGCRIPVGSMRRVAAGSGPRSAAGAAPVPANYGRTSHDELLGVPDIAPPRPGRLPRAAPFFRVTS